MRIISRHDSVYSVTVKMARPNSYHAERGMQLVRINMTPIFDPWKAAFGLFQSKELEF